MFSAKGRLDQQYKYSRSTSKIKTTTNSVENEHDSSDLTLLLIRNNVVFATITDFDNCFPTRKISTNQTERFTILSNRGNQYIMIIYDYDSNAILIE